MTTAELYLGIDEEIAALRQEEGSLLGKDRATDNGYGNALVRKPTVEPLREDLKVQTQRLYKAQQARQQQFEDTNLLVGTGQRNYPAMLLAGVTMIVVLLLQVL